MRLQIEALHYSYNGDDQKHVLDDINLNISSGEFVAVIGPSGCGKSTLLRMIANLLPVKKGSLLLDSQQPMEMIETRRVAWMAQRPALIPWMNVRQNVEVGVAHHHKKNGIQINPLDALQMVGLQDEVSSYPFTLSGGMQQRLALARTISLNADLWLMDEPFASLDELTREKLSGELLGVWKMFKPTVLWVTHQIHEALFLADRVLVMSPAPGRIVEDMTVDLERPRCESDLQFQELLAGLRQSLGMVSGNGHNCMDEIS
ncbi:MAG: ATP-binding cassette domain-containing protein [Anaerolineaceae bacterium]|nr:ATP-binding cassette domain-containing protein [Anaerolineaceae bacterium]